ncbi:MAG: hydroxyacid dehydrogenase [Pseudomonadota bacterium]
MPKVVLVEPMAPIATELFTARGFDIVQLPEAPAHDAILEAARDADALAVRIAKLPADIIEAAPSLKVVAKHGVGTDNIDVASCTAHRIPVTVTADANKTSVVEHTLMFMLALAKKLVPLDRATRDGDFTIRSRPDGFGVDLGGRTALLVGGGRIGSALVPVLRALGMTVIVSDHAFGPEDATRLQCERVDDFREHLSRADFLSVHVPLTAETRGLVGSRELDALPSHAFVINCARGGIVDETALLEALDGEHIAGAATDVFDGEPPAPDHPFFTCDKILLAPHAGGNTLECLDRMARATAENIIAAFDGTLERRLVVNPEVLKANGSD